MSGGRESQIASKQGKFIVSTKREVCESLAGDDNFLLFLGWLTQRCGLTDAHDTNNGSEAFKVMGRRQIAVETLGEVQQFVPDVYEKVLRRRREFEAQVKTQIQLTPEEVARANEEED